MHTHSLLPASFLSNPVIRGADFGNSAHSRKSAVEGNAFEHVRNRDNDTFQRSLPTEDNILRQTDSTMSFHSLEKSLSQSADIQIRTQEGDVITISFQSLEESSKTAFQLDQGNSQIRTYSENQSSELDFRLSIEGDLNEDEQKAIHQLMQKMKKVSKEFFQGDINAAFEHAQKLGFNSQQISGFSMDLNRTESVQAVAAYKQTSYPAQNVNADLLKRASDFVSQVEDFMADSAIALESFADPKQSFLNLFSGIGQLFSRVEDESEEIAEKPLFLDMLKHIADIEFGQEVEESKRAEI